MFYVHIHLDCIDRYLGGLGGVFVWTATPLCFSV